MNEIESVVTEVLETVAVNEARVTPEASIRDQLGIDSVTFLMVLFQIQERLGVDFTQSGGRVANVSTVDELARLCRALRHEATA